MYVTFWGVRGSVPVPGPKTQHYGGNTACVEVRSGAHRLIFDAGTGLRDLGTRLDGQRCREFHIVLSHCHFDHLSGLPFFAPLYRDDTTLHIYGPKGEAQGIKQTLGTFFSKEFFPVPFERLPATLHFHSLRAKRFSVAPFTIRSLLLNHPSRTLGYVISEGSAQVAYLTDHEPIAQFRHLKGIKARAYEDRLTETLAGSDLLIHDAQYTDHQYPNYRGWGHAPWQYAVDLAQAAGIPKLALFHHAPQNDDSFLKAALRTLRRELKRRKTRVQVLLAREGESIRL